MHWPGTVLDYENLNHCNCSKLQLFVKLERHKHTLIHIFKSNHGFYISITPSQSLLPFHPTTCLEFLHSSLVTAPLERFSACHCQFTVQQRLKKLFSIYIALFKIVMLAYSIASDVREKKKKKNSQEKSSPGSNNCPSEIGIWHWKQFGENWFSD